MHVNFGISIHGLPKLTSIEKSKNSVGPIIILHTKKKKMQSMKASTEVYESVKVMSVFCPFEVLI